MKFLPTDCQTRWLRSVFIACLFGASIGVVAADRFEFTPFPRTQTSGVPFHVSIRAVDESGQLDGTYQGRVRLSAIDSIPTTGLILTEVDARSHTLELMNPTAEPIQAAGWRIDSISARYQASKLVLHF